MNAHSFYYILSDYIGLFGVVLILIAYYLCQAESWTFNDMRYLMANLVGSLCILFSLFFNWNLSAVVIEICWVAISIYGMTKRTKKRSLESVNG